MVTTATYTGTKRLPPDKKVLFNYKEHCLRQAPGASKPKS